MSLRYVHICDILSHIERPRLSPRSVVAMSRCATARTDLVCANVLDHGVERVVEVGETRHRIRVLWGCAGRFERCGSIGDPLCSLRARFIGCSRRRLGNDSLPTFL